MARDRTEEWCERFVARVHEKTPGSVLAKFDDTWPASEILFRGVRVVDLIDPGSTESPEDVADRLCPATIVGATTWRELPPLF